MFRGGIFSKKNYLLGLAVMCNNQIVYSDSKLKTFSNLDKDARLGYMTSTLNSLESVKNNLKTNGGNSDTVSVDDDTLLNDVNDVQRSISAWFAMIPLEDVEAADQLFKVKRVADVNRDGKLDASELATLPEKEREIWLKCVTLIGD
jgi:hypothetical protein